MALNDSRNNYIWYDPDLILEQILQVGSTRKFLEDNNVDR
jgi:hypothetical protein